MTREEFINICKQNQIEIDESLDTQSINLIKKVKGWDNQTRCVRLCMEIDAIQYDEIVSVAIDELNRSCKQSHIPDKQTVIKEWVSAKQLSQQLNIPYWLILKQLKMCKISMATNINRIWYCSPSG